MCSLTKGRARGRQASAAGSPWEAEHLTLGPSSQGSDTPPPGVPRERPVCRDGIGRMFLGRAREAGPYTCTAPPHRGLVACLLCGQRLASICLLNLLALFPQSFLILAPLLSPRSFPSFPFHESPQSPLFSHANEAFGLCGLEGTGQVERSIICRFLSQPAFPSSPSFFSRSSLH